MFSRTRLALSATVLALLSAQPSIRAQAARGAAQATNSEASVLAKGWNAVAAGNAAEAERLSDSLLKASPGHHHALALKMAARLGARTPVGTLSALDAYESWLGHVNQREDVFLLEPVAMQIIDTLAQSQDRAVRARALEIKAALGDTNAATQLRTTGDEPGSGALMQDAALARQQDPGAIERLTRRVNEPGTRDVSAAIDALGTAKVATAVPAILAALDPRRPLPTRMAAARALGRLGSVEAIPRLKQALNDPDPPVRIVAAVSLSTLGDTSGDEIVRSIEKSPVGDFRLLAVEAHAATDPAGAWVEVATGVLQDPDPLVRLRAAELLLRHAANPGPAFDVLRQALSDDNPAMQQAAADQLDRIPATTLDRDVPTLRKLLRSRSPRTQIESAAAFLRIAGTLRQ